jgi:Fe-S-cluster-containing dehydrogenase component
MITRRDFIKKGVVIIAIGLPFAGGSIARIAKTEARNLWVYVVDTTKCIGCGMCVKACRTENSVPEERYRTWVERYIVFADSVHVEAPHGGEEGYEDVKTDKEVVRAYFVPKLCFHCDEPPCVVVCPVYATWKTDDGVVLIDYDHCIGCKYCVQACPYSARFFNEERGTADKCTWCYHRLHRGLMPACVTVCPNGARIFGRAEDEKIQGYLKKFEIRTLRPELNTKPRVYYFGIGPEVI